MITGYSHLRCGLLGEHLGHSFSPRIYGELVDYSYDIIELPPTGWASLFEAEAMMPLT